MDINELMTGAPSNECIMATFDNTVVYLNKKGVYIIEDNKHVHKKL